MAQIKKNKEITLSDLAALIKSESARVENNLNKMIDDLAVASKCEFDLIRQEMKILNVETSRISAKVDNGFVELRREVQEVVMDNQFIKRKLSDIQTGMGGYISIYRFDRFKKYNKLKEELDASVKADK